MSNDDRGEEHHDRACECGARGREDSAPSPARLTQSPQSSVEHTEERVNWKALNTSIRYATASMLVMLGFLFLFTQWTNPSGLEQSLQGDTWLDKVMTAPAEPNHAPAVGPDGNPSTEYVDEVLNGEYDTIDLNPNPEGRYSLLEGGKTVNGILTPGRWCPGVINYTIDFTALKAAGLSKRVEKARWRKTFRMWQHASGGAYQFRYAGEAEHKLIALNTPGAGTQVDNVVDNEIAITYGMSGDMMPGYQSDQLYGSLGYGGMESPRFDQSVTPEETGQAKRAAIVVDVFDVPKRGVSPTRVYVHETGHALGLGHVDNGDALMNAGEDGPRTPQPDDKAGIRKLLAVGCAPAQ